MIINAFASEQHYANKIIPIWNKLHPAMRGTFNVHPRLDGLVEGAQIADRPIQDDLLMVASQKDANWAKGKFIYIEHGAGQAYDPKRWYSNSNRPNMLAALVPGPHCAKVTAQANPGVPVIEMGAPHLAGIDRTGADRVVFAFHWRCGVVLEADTAFDEYASAMVEVSQRWKTLGHGHPRIIGELSGFYKQNGMEFTYDSESALGKAGLLVADNTSLIYEAAALGIPVVLLNRSDWRRDRTWGLRFWDAMPGPQVDTPGEMADIIAGQIDGGAAEWDQARQMCTSYVYGSDPFNKLDQAVTILHQVVTEHANTY